MKTKYNLVIDVVRMLIEKLNPDLTFHIILVIFLIFLILGSDILADILLEQLLQADGVTRLHLLGR